MICQTCMTRGEDASSGLEALRAQRHTGIPAVVMMDSCVDENTRCPPSRAACQRRVTRLDKFSESPNCMVVEVEEVITGRKSRSRG